MKTYKIYADLHFFGPHKINMTQHLSNTNSVYLGDIYDCSNCKKSDIKTAMHYKKHLREHIGQRYVSGNHELDTVNQNYIDKGILFTHGDFVFWGKKKSLKFRNREAGSGTLKRFFVKIIHKYFRPLWSPKTLTGKQIDQAYNYARNLKCHTIVMGHLHPKKIINIKYRQVRIIVVPRGLTKMPL